MRIGHGYDVHRLSSGRRLVIGGVEISHHYGLLGHSDADVLTHAVIDALLGAAGLGDIGRAFPDSDPAYEGISSLLLLGRVAQRLKEQNWRIMNIDVSIVAQQPKLVKYIPEMEQNLARCTGIPPDCVNVKATTEEGLGFTGREEGIAAHAVALIARGDKIV